MKTPKIDRELIQRLCLDHHVDRLYLFGSAVTGGMTSDSDLDFLVKFKEFEVSDYFKNYIHLKDELQKMLGKNIDLIEHQTLKNPVLIKSINRNKELIYGSKK